MKIVFLICLSLLPLSITASVDEYHPRHRVAGSNKQSTQYAGNAGLWDNVDWNALATRELEEAIRVTDNVNKNKAKNVIMFIGDGLGLSTVSAARLYHAELRSLKAEDSYLSFEKLPHVGLSRTYNVDSATSDSAGTATAYLCGVKANLGTIGVTDQVKRGECSAITEETKVRSIVKESIKEGKWTGVVTTTRITHASPASSYAHASDRGWEAYTPSDPYFQNQTACDDIAKQLINDTENQRIRVILGGGLRSFLPTSPQPDYNNMQGEREDNWNLIDEWKQKHTAGHFVMNKTQFDIINPVDTNYLLGLFSSSHMDYEADRTDDQPSLTDMTQKAIEILQRGPDGYFLFVEAGRIDHSHHANVAFKALNDTVALSDAVQLALDMTSEEDTLIVVSADHSHVMTFGGYGSFATSVLDVTDDGWADDGKPFLQIHYANGPGFYAHRIVNGSDSTEQPRLNLTNADTGTINFEQDAAVPLGSETHGGEDVAIHARGPMSHLFHGVHEQNYIAHVMMYASCVGTNRGPHCSAATTQPPTISSAVALHIDICLHFVLMLAAVLTAVRRS